MSNNEADMQRATSSTVIGFGDPILDIVSSVSFDTLEQLQMEEGGCTSISRSALDHLLSLAEVRTNILKVPGGSAANVCKGLASLAGGTGSSVISFVGMVGYDGDLYRRMLEAHGVRPLLAQCPLEGEPTGTCLCLISPDGQRTMRTHLGAAAQLQAADQLPPELDFQGAGVVHFEGYAMFKPVVIEAAMRAAAAAGAKVSIDLASFEVVKHSWGLLEELLRKGLLQIIFCNEDEARALVQAAGLSSDAGGGNSNGALTDADAEAAVKAAQTYLLQFCELVVISRGAKGCVAATSAGHRAAAKAFRVDIVDTVGAGDLFASGFLHAWMSGASLQACAVCGCAAGAEAVQAAGAELGEEAVQQLREKVGKIISDDENKF